jgi:hypothetical protein
MAHRVGRVFQAFIVFPGRRGDLARLPSAYVVPRPYTSDDPHGTWIGRGGQLIVWIIHLIPKATDPIRTRRARRPVG